MTHVSAQDTGPVQWTPIGIRRHAACVVTKELAYKKFVEENGDLLGQKGFTDEGSSVDQSGAMQMKTQLHGAWRAAEQFNSRLAEMPRPRDANRACSGLRITIQYLDDEIIRHRGESESFLRGGIGESDSDALLRTYSADSPLGKAVVGKEVGDVVTVKLPHDRSYDVEITAIEFLTEDDIVAASTMRPRTEQSVLNVELATAA